MSEKEGVSKEVSTIKEKIKELNLGQISELIDGLKKDLNIQEQAIVQPTATVQTKEKVAEKSGNVSIKLTEIGPNKFEIYKEIMSIQKEEKSEVMGPVQAKRLTEEGDKIIL